jgi:triosephosphate isomerase
MRKKILAANWKMNLTQSEVQEWLASYTTQDWSNSAVQLRVYPSAIYLKDVQHNNLHVGAQNAYHEPMGAFTGELSIAQLQSIGVQSVLIGHSERRLLFKEDTALLTQKVNACAGADFPFILCCGEPLETREAGAHLTFVLSQLTESLSQLAPSQLHLLVVAYEPIWAIGTGLSANTDQITEMHLAISNHLIDLFGAAAQEVSILYGGSVHAENAAAIFSCPNVDGALVGGAALDPLHFHQLYKALQA